jgi:hypothetical protein
MKEDGRIIHWNTEKNGGDAAQSEPRQVDGDGLTSFQNVHPGLE